MRNFNEIFKCQLNDYFNGKQTKEELGSWAKREYYKILTGDCCIIEMLAVYKYLKIISSFHLEVNDIKDEYPCSEDNVHDIKEIISGNKSDVLFGDIKIQRVFYKKYSTEDKLEGFEKLKDIMLRIRAQKSLNLKEQDHLKKIMEFKTDDVITIIDLIELNIINALKKLNAKQSNLMFNQDFSLYRGHEVETEKIICDDLIRLLNCALGKSSLKVCISFQFGNAMVLIST